MNFSPMLACSTIPTSSQIQFPVIGSPKLDGIRCVIKDGQALSRTLKPIPNRFVQQHLSNRPELNGLDGELMLRCGDFNSVQSAFMSEGGEPDFCFNVFDSFSHPTEPFERRQLEASMRAQAASDLHIQAVEQMVIFSESDLDWHVERWLAQGFEGAIIRTKQSPYKFGRSTMNQGWMLKIKHFFDDEAEIVGFEELMHNLDPGTNKLENQVPGATLGALIVQWQGKTFKIGTGFTAEQRLAIWNSQANWIGLFVKFKYQELSRYGIPRFPVWLDTRHPHDCEL